jgi:hypothetical protein
MMTVPSCLNNTVLPVNIISTPALVAVPTEIKFALREGTNKTFLNSPGSCFPSTVAVKSMVPWPRTGKEIPPIPFTSYCPFCMGVIEEK